MNAIEKPTVVSFVKNKQCEELNPADLGLVRQDCRLTHDDVRPNCKCFIHTAVHTYIHTYCTFYFCFQIKKNTDLTCSWVAYASTDGSC